MQINIRWCIESNSGNVCFVSHRVFDALHLSQTKKYTLHFGQHTQEITFRPLRVCKKCLYLTPDLFIAKVSVDELSIFEEITLNIWKQGQDIYLGPVLGIFVRPGRLTVPKELSPTLSHMKAGHQEHFLCYYFSIHNIDWEHKRIRGFTMDPGVNTWIYGWFPLPDVVYDRGAGFAEEQKAAVREIRERLRNDFRVKFINSLDYIGKWQTYRNLSKYKEIAKHLPITIRYTDFEDIIDMLNQYGFIFIKSYYGSQGKQVMSIEKYSDSYRLVSNSGKLSDLTVRDIGKVKYYVERFTKNRSYIIQQGIRLHNYEGSLFDMRVLMIKDKKGKWIARSNYARIAKFGSTITNYCSGGECDYYSNVYPHLTSSIGNYRMPDCDDVASVAKKISSAIDHAFGMFGELGIDLAIDESGGIWFIEANTKPDKDLVEGVDDCRVIQPQYTAIFDYAGFLCGKQNHRIVFKRERN